MQWVVSSEYLRKRLNEVILFCWASKEPVYVKYKGRDALVVIDAAAYNREANLKKMIRKREMRRRSLLLDAHEALREKGDVPSHMVPGRDL